MKHGDNNAATSVIDFIRHRKADVGLLFAGVLLGVLFDWNIVEITIFSVFIWSILGPISTRTLAAAALFFLSVVPFLLVLDREDQAEQYAIYAYYFLVMTVIRAVIDRHVEKKQ